MSPDTAPTGEKVGLVPPLNHGAAGRIGSSSGGRWAGKTDGSDASKLLQRA